MPGTTGHGLTLCETIDRFRSIATWAHSNLFFGSYGYLRVAIFRVHAAEREAMLLTLWKDLCSVEKDVVLTLWICASLHPRALQWSCTQFLSWCPVCWAGSERFASSQVQLRSRQQRGLDVYLSIWEDCAMLEKLGSLSETWKTWDATQEATYFAVLALCAHSSCWLLFETIIGKLFSVPWTFGFVFVISETKVFRQDKVVISKSASFSDKKRSCRIAFFSILYSWQWPHKGLTGLSLLPVTGERRKLAISSSLKFHALLFKAKII